MILMILSKNCFFYQPNKYEIINKFQYSNIINFKTVPQLYISETGYMQAIVFNFQKDYGFLS